MQPTKKKQTTHKNNSNIIITSLLYQTSLKSMIFYIQLFICTWDTSVICIKTFLWLFVTE